MPNYNTYTPMYQPYSYQPYQYQAPIQQPIQPPVQPTVQQQTMPNYSLGSANMIWVKGRDAAMLYPVAPNNAVPLWDELESVVYLKQADASGKPTLKTFDLVERAETPADGSKNDGSTDTAYATKEDVAALAGVVKGFDGMIASMRGDIEKMSGDLYGLAGSKKKSTKKAESEEETE